MSIEKKFFKKVKTNLTKTGYTRKKYVIIKCDSCGKIKETSLYSVMRGRKNHPDFDYCVSCSKRNRRISVNGEDHGNFKHGMSSHGYKRITFKVSFFL